MGAEGVQGEQGEPGEDGSTNVWFYDTVGVLPAPVVETGWETVLQEAKDAGIPVIMVDRRADVHQHAGRGDEGDLVPDRGAVTCGADVVVAGATEDEVRGAACRGDDPRAGADAGERQPQAGQRGDVQRGDREELHQAALDRHVEYRYQHRQQD